MPSPPIPELARMVAGAISGGNLETWWRPLLSWDAFQAEAVSWLRLTLRRCPHHAALEGAVVTHHLRQVCQLEDGGCLHQLDGRG